MQKIVRPILGCLIFVLFAGLSIAPVLAKESSWWQNFLGFRSGLFMSDGYGYGYGFNPDDAPQNLAVTKRQTTKIKLAYDSVDYADYYKIQVRRPAGTLVKTVTKLGTAPWVNGLSSDTRYKFRVRAVAADGTKGAWSSYVSAKTKILTTTKLAIKGLSKERISKNNLRVSWKKTSGLKDTEEPVYYVIELKNNSNDQEIRKVITKESIILKNLKPKNTYQLKIRARQEKDGEMKYGPWNKKSVKKYTAVQSLRRARNKK